MTFCRVYNKDCDSLKEVGDSTVQFAMTVLPDIVTGKTSIEEEISPQLLYNRTYLIESLLPFFRPMLLGIHRVLKDDGVFVLNASSCVRYPSSVSFCALLPLIYAEYVVQVTGLRLVRDFIIVQKPTEKGYVADEKEFDFGLVALHQHLLMFTKGTSPKMNYAGPIPSVWTYHMEPQEKGIPTRFPPALTKRLVEMFSDENDILLDPLAGTGSLAYSGCRMLRNAVLYEINPEYIPYIRKNVEVEGVEVEVIDSLR